MAAVNLTHMLITGPLILFIAIANMSKVPINSAWYKILLVFSAIAISYHMFLFYKNAKGNYGRYINILHLLLGSLLMFVAVSNLQNSSINEFWYTLMAILGFGAIGIHMYKLSSA